MNKSALLRRRAAVLACLLSIALIASSAGPSFAAEPVRRLQPSVRVEVVAYADTIDALFGGEIDRQLASGEITQAQAEEARRALLRPDRAPAAVPAIILGAAAGCAVAVLVGEGKDQVKNLAKTGHVDEASDIALGATIDCILGAVPGAWAKGFARKAADALKSKIKVVIKEVIKKLFL